MPGTTDALTPTPLPELSASPSSSSNVMMLGSLTSLPTAARAGINFPDEDEATAHRPSGIGLPRVGTKELRLNRELTRDEKDLANAGYQKEVKDPKSEPKHVDIVRSQIPCDRPAPVGALSPSGPDPSAIFASRSSST